MKIKDIILGFMKEEAYRPMTMLELSKIFNINKAEYKQFKKVFKALEAEGLIARDEEDRFGLIDKVGLIPGKIQIHQKGFGFLIPDEEGVTDVFIPKNALNGAMNGDRVLGKVVKESQEGKRREGEIVRITERVNTKVIGIYEDNKSFGFVLPQDQRIQNDIFISKKDRNGAKKGNVVVVEITKWPDGRRKNPEGVVVEILGNRGDLGLDIITVIKKYALPEEFPPQVLAFAEEISEEIPESEIKRRTDLRDVKMVTIDGEDAKDLDDAVSIERLPNGNYKLGVHIADVTHYVKENNPLDKEAFKRATSVYLVDRVIPMLPKKLSNGICSLNPQVDRLALTCFMEIDHKGNVVNHSIHESVIKTNERMTYTDVTKILRDNDKELIERYKDLVDDFKAMEELCKILNKRRMGRGAIDFEFAESKIILDEKGKPIDIKPYERAIANRIIEEFMLVCNETIAEYMNKAEIPFVYRIHEEPDNEKLQRFKNFAYSLGYSFNFGELIEPRDLQKVVEEVKGENEEMVINTLLLRSMMQARYSPDCAGHFGLAAEYYCHFTSPIRRYPDLQIHRIIKEQLNNKLNNKRQDQLAHIVEYASTQSSERERAAELAERDVHDFYKACYMADKVGQEFDGVVSSVTSFGMFVELENTVEGLIRLANMRDDYYIYNQETYTIMGERSHKTFKIGDTVRIKVDNVNVDFREIDFVLISKLEDSHIEEDLQSEE